ncbi:MAG: HEAT repeat domain-containing protein [Chloroflexaceae bacterium]|nr:HEAT repeat domain-containing protein [Chloroflexaceae bacterium]
MELVELLKELGNTSQQVSAQTLALFSGLDARSTAALRDAWRRIPTARRREIVQSFHTLAEDLVDMDFNQMFLFFLGDADVAVRVLAIDGLWEDERISTLHHLLERFDDPSSEVRAAVVAGLSHFAYRAEVGDLAPDAAHLVYQALLRVCLDQAEPLEVRRRAVEGIGYFRDLPEAQEEIGRAYAHPHHLMRESALVAMGRSMHPMWFATIERELRNPSPAMRYEAARAAGELSEEGCGLLPALIPLIEDEDLEVFQAVAWSLGQIGGAHARRVLHRLTTSSNPSRAQAAREALEELVALDLEEEG